VENGTNHLSNALDSGPCNHRSGSNLNGSGKRTGLLCTNVAEIATMLYGREKMMNKWQVTGVGTHSLGYFVASYDRVFRSNDSGKRRHNSMTQPHDSLITAVKYGNFSNTSNPKVSSAPIPLSFRASSNSVLNLRKIISSLTT